MISLREAQEQGKLSQFLKEHADERGDAEAVAQIVSSMAGKSSEAPKASSRRGRSG